MPDPAAIRSALISKLNSDLALLAQATNGVYYQVASVDATRFVIVSQVTGEYVQQFEQRAYDDRLFLVEARMRKGVGEDAGVVAARASAAAARIDELLDPQPPLPPATLTVPGYGGLMVIQGEEPFDVIEHDEANLSIIWFRRGANYRVMVST